MKIKNLDKSLYPSVKDAIWEILDRHCVFGVGEATVPSFYSDRALNEVCCFLALNDIPHSYTITPAPTGLECGEIVSIAWYESGELKQEVWYTSNKNKRFFRTTLLIVAEDVQEVEDWISAIDNIDFKEWSVEEV
jgi:hypothetical protein